MNSDGIFSFLFTRHRHQGIIRHGKRVNAQDASAESTPDLQLEIAYFLLIEIAAHKRN